jgi:hypothetical protein
MQRVLRWDGLLPYVPGRELTPADVREMSEYVDANRTAGSPFDIVVEGVSPGEDADRAAETIRPWKEAGATWWIEALWGQPGQAQDLESVRARVLQGPPAGFNRD